MCIFAKHSAFSYEDLPSDKYGADFGANYFDGESQPNHYNAGKEKNLDQHHNY